MFVPHVLRFSALALLLAFALPAAAQRGVATEFDREYALVSRFLKAVDAYVVQHHRMFEPLPDEIMCLPAETLAEINALAAVPSAARPAPREGGIFAADLADLFRRRIAATIRRHEYNRADLLAEMDEEGLVAPPVVVNEPLPWGLGNALLPSLAGELPLLPEELAYRLVGRDLVLTDVEFDLVVDVIRDALPAY